MNDDTTGTGPDPGEVLDARLAARLAALSAPAGQAEVDRLAVILTDGQWLTCTEDGTLDLREELLATRAAVRAAWKAIAGPGRAAPCGCLNDFEHGPLCGPVKSALQAPRPVVRVLTSQDAPAGGRLLCDNQAVMAALMRALSDPGQVTPRAPLESLQSWQRRAVIEHAAPLIAAAERDRYRREHDEARAQLRQMDEQARQAIAAEAAAVQQAEHERDDLRTDYDALIARLERSRARCPDGCGCLMDGEDADARECGCDGPCTMECRENGYPEAMSYRDLAVKHAMDEAEALRYAVERITEESAGMRAALRRIALGLGVKSQAQASVIADKALTAWHAGPEATAPARPPVVCLCGSTRFVDEFNRQRKELTEQGEIVLSIEVVTTQARENDPQHCDPALKARLDELHKRKIDMCDYALVLNVGGYIGESTRSEIDYAIAHGKPVRYLEARDDA